MCAVRTSTLHLLVHLGLTLLSLGLMITATVAFLQTFGLAWSAILGSLSGFLLIEGADSLAGKLSLKIR